MQQSNEIPKRPGLWLDEKKVTYRESVLFDFESIVFSIGLIVFVLVVFAPIFFQISFDEVFATPFVPALVYILDLVNVDTLASLSAIYLLAFIIASCGLYLLVRDYIQRQIPAVVASILFLIPPISLYIINYYRYGLDVVQLQRTTSFFSIWYGDVSHFLALSLIPFTILFFQRYLKYAKTFNFTICVLLCAVILLTNVSHSLTLLIILLVVALNSLLLGMARLKLKRLFFVIIFSIGLISFWYTPSFLISSFASFTSYIFSNFNFIFPLPFILTLIGIFISYVFFGKREDRRLIFISFLLFSVFFALSFDWIVNNRSLLPSPHRLLPVLNIFGSIVVALVLTAVVDWFMKFKKIGIGNQTRIVKSLLWLNVGLVTFVFFLFVANIIKPYLIRFVSAPNGIWDRLVVNVLEDQRQMIETAGGLHVLIGNNRPQYEVILGIIITGIFITWISLLLIRAVRVREKDEF